MIEGLPLLTPAGLQTDSALAVVMPFATGESSLVRNQRQHDSRLLVFVASLKIRPRPGVAALVNSRVSSVGSGSGTTNPSLYCNSFSLNRFVWM